MRTADNINDVWSKLVEDLLNAPRVGNTRELLNVSFAIDDPRNNVLSLPGRKFSETYASAELAWYFSGSGSVLPIAEYAPQYLRFAEDDAQVHGAYGPRLRTQLQKAYNLLSNKSGSRQVVVSIWKPEDIEFAGAVRDVPCTLTLQFLVRDDSLVMIVNMRSNDVWLGMPNDVFCWTTIQVLMAESLGLQVGPYFHNVGSMHLYDHNLESAKVTCQETGPRLMQAFATIPLGSFTKAKDVVTFCEAICRRTRCVNPNSVLRREDWVGTRVAYLIDNIHRRWKS